MDTILHSGEFLSSFGISNISEVEDGKIKFSFFKDLINSFNKRMLNEAIKMHAVCKDLYKQMAETKYSEKEIKELSVEIKKVLPAIISLNEIFESFEYDNSIEETIILTFRSILSYLLKISVLVKTYHDVNIANQEVEKGEIITHQELWDGAI